MDKPLTLYFNALSFYSQKARFFLEEKGIPYMQYRVDLHDGECYTPWYMTINPAGKVPVLKHGDQYIADSLDIMEYVEKTFVDTPKLLADPSTPEGRLIQTFCNQCRECALEKISYGIQLFPELTKDSEVPEFLRRFMIKRMLDPSGVLEMFTKKAEQYPELREVYLLKRQGAEEMFQFAKEPTARETVMAEVEKCKKIYDAAEEQLQKNMDAGKADMWLCSERFSVADLELALLCRRLKLLGLVQCTWTDGKHPNVEKYFKRLCSRKTFQDASLNVAITSDQGRFFFRRHGSRLLKALLITAAVGGLGYVLCKRFKTV